MSSSDDDMMVGVDYSKDYLNSNLMGWLWEWEMLGVLILIYVSRLYEDLFVPRPIMPQAHSICISFIILYFKIMQNSTYLQKTPSSNHHT